MAFADPKTFYLGGQMSYKNIYDVLPKKLVEQIQEHIDGVKLYIPKKPNNRIAWCSNTDTKELIFLRNQQIRSAYESGITISELSQIYFLAEKTIQKIIYSK